MQKGWLVAVMLLLLLAPSVLAECYVTNVCDVNHPARYLDAAQDARRHYLGMATLFQDNEPTTAAYPAVLFYASQPDTAGMATQILTDELDAAPLAVDAHESALYLAWTLELYSGSLDVELVTRAEAELDSYVSGSSIPSKLEDKFMRTTAIYLRTDGTNKETFVIPRLRSEGDAGWGGDTIKPLENNPARLAKVTTALAALFDAAPDAEVRKLAEMNLDALFTRFAASSVKGAWNSPTAGNTLATVDVVQSPWYGWSHLVLGDAEKGSTTEPSMLVSNYCAHGITHVLPGEVRRVLDNTANNADLATAATATYALSAARDIVQFDHNDGYITKARAHFGDYKKFIELNSRTCPEPEDQQYEDAQTFLLDNNVVLGKLDAATAECGEPHAFFGVGMEASYILDDNVPHGVVVKAGNEYAIIRFLGPVQTAHITERYAGRANSLPTWMLENGAGHVLYPTSSGTNGGVFSLEIASLDFVSEALNECYDSEVDCIAAAAAGNTSLEYDSGTITYTTKTSGQNVEYEYEPGGSATIDSAAVSTSDHALRRVVDLTSDWAWFEKKEGVWILQGQYPPSNNALVTLDFTAETVETMKTVEGDPSSYDCENVPPTAGGMTGEFSSLGFAAASLLDIYEEDDHLLDCAPGTDALPNSQLYPSGLLNGACVLMTGDKRVVAMAINGGYGGDDGKPLEEALKSLNVYFPFLKNADFNFTNLDMCDQAWEDTAEPIDEKPNPNYKDCGSISVRRGSVGLLTHDPLHAWINGGHNILVISTDSNPFTNGWWSDGIGDWFTNLFTANLAGGPDPASVPSFDAAHFRKEGDKELRAVLVENKAELIAKELVQSLEPIADKYGSTYKAVDTTQYLLFSSADAAQGGDWALHTRALRLGDVEGDPYSGTSYCDDQAITYLPECDNPGEVHEQCPDDAERDILCTANPNGCRLDYSECELCVDLDDDGEEACGNPETDDCLDQDPATYFVLLADGSPQSCAGVVANGPACDEAPTSKCPQCIRHSDDEVQVSDNCDYVNNDCEGVTDPGCKPSDYGDVEPPKSYECGEVPPPAAGGDELTSDHGLTCDNFQPGPRLKVGELGTYIIKEYYTDRESTFADPGDPAIAIVGSDDQAACHLFGHSSQWHIRDDSLMHLFVDLTSYRDGGGTQVTVSWPYPVWTSVIGPTDPWYNNPIVHQNPKPNVYVQVERTKLGADVKWNLKATVKASASEQELSRFVRCWYGGNRADLKTDSVYDQVKVKAWAGTEFPTIGDTMAVPCEEAPEEPPVAPPSTCDYICDVAPECDLVCDTTNCATCASTAGCVPHDDCESGSGICDGLTACAGQGECLPTEFCHPAGCCFPVFDGPDGKPWIPFQQLP